MHYRLRRYGCLLGISLLLVSCGQESGGGGGGGQMSYKEVKSMVIDILGSEEAQKAMEKASTAQYGESTLQIKSMTPSDQAQVRIAVKDVLTAPEYSTVLEKIMKDPKFAGEFAKAISKDNKQIHKDLMKDPAYQKELVDTFKTPEMLKILTDSMKTTDVRKLIMSSVSESMQNPLFKLEIMKLLQTVVKEELTPKPEKKSEKKGGSGEGGGGSSEGGEGGGQSSGDGGG
ncbi:spore germination lipoprotein GerD [Cohnella silvisoli]|uniref:Spore germination lipoprotein GerD n=1 Tax=Cohnella silvisoli TaxID=2873699 RepID=A0ABV1L4W1_9BACL|nr:spore germination lipoprotein GerD [Cohnella silvisoli]MCD9026398.1 spore gernimation protein [Cohnella silvisoli]